MNREFFRYKNITANTTINIDGTYTGHWLLIADTIDFTTGSFVLEDPTGHGNLGDTMSFYYIGSSNTNYTDRISILGEIMPAEYVNKSLMIWATNTGASWNVNMVPSFSQSNLIDSDHILSSAVTEGKIGALAVTEGKIGAGAVVEAKLGDAAVTTNKIGNLQVTAGKIASDAVIEAKILNSAVTADKIAAGAVTGGKIAVDAVTTTKIIDDAITTDKILNDAVTTLKILDLNITAGKIAADAVTTTKIADNQVTVAKLAHGDGNKVYITDASGVPTLAANTTYLNDYKIMADSGDASPGYLDAKVDLTTIGVNASNKLYNLLIEEGSADSSLKHRDGASVASGIKSTAFNESTASGIDAFAAATSTASGTKAAALSTGLAAADTSTAVSGGKTDSGADYSFATGKNATAKGYGSIAQGEKATAHNTAGGRVFSSSMGQSKDYGSSQFEEYTLSGQTIDDGTDVLQLVGNLTEYNLSIPDNAAMGFTGTLVAQVKTPGSGAQIAGDSACWMFKGLIKKVGVTTSLVDEVWYLVSQALTTEALTIKAYKKESDLTASTRYAFSDEDMTSCGVGITANDTNDALYITVQGVGAGSCTIEWTASVQFTSCAINSII